jgi:hypothetical protein
MKERKKEMNSYTKKEAEVDICKVVSTDLANWGPSTDLNATDLHLLN